MNIFLKIPRGPRLNVRLNDSAGQDLVGQDCPEDIYSDLTYLDRPQRFVVDGGAVYKINE